MSSLQNVCHALLISHSTNLINDEEFFMLYNHNTSKNPDFPYSNYQQFDLENLSYEECKAEFCFYKNDIYFLKEALHIFIYLLTLFQFGIKNHSLYLQKILLIKAKSQMRSFFQTDK